MRSYWLPLTYPPKIPKVLSGECTQTIRPGRKYRVGDRVAFHGWGGTPYRSKWSFKTPYWEVIWITQITLFPDGIGYLYSEFGSRWTWASVDDVALLDGIDPPTGEELGRVLLSMHKIPPEGLPAQIIRWKWSE